MTALSLRGGVAWTAAGNAVYVACQYGMLVALAKLGTQEDVGTFALALALTAPIILVSQMQLRQLLVTDVQYEARFGDYLTVRLGLTVAALLLIPILLTIGGYDQRTTVVTLGVALAKALESIADIAHGRIQQAERMDLVARSLALKGVLSLVAFTTALALTGSLLVAIGGIGFVWGAVLATYDMTAIRGLTPPSERRLAWRPGVFGGLVRTALPLALAGGLSSFSVNLPRYFLDADTGKEAVALFAAAATPLALIMFVWTAVSQATLPRAARYLSAGDHRAFSRLALRLVGLHVVPGIAVVALLAGYGETLMTMLFAPDYAGAGPVAALMAAGVTLGGLGAYGAAVLTAGRHFPLMAWHVVVLTAVQLPLTFMLVREFGLWGAAWSEVTRNLVSVAYLTVAGAIVLRRRRPDRPTRDDGTPAGLDAHG
jgi:O-antigen/teichoic acid export membrane protein